MYCFNTVLGKLFEFLKRINTFDPEKHRIFLFLIDKQLINFMYQKHIRSNLVKHILLCGLTSSSSITPNFRVFTYERIVTSFVTTAAGPPWVLAFSSKARLPPNVSLSDVPQLFVSFSFLGSPLLLSLLE